MAAEVPPPTHRRARRRGSGWMRSVLFAAIVVVVQGAARALEPEPLDRGVAIADPQVLRNLEEQGLGLGAMVDVSGSTTSLLANDSLIRLPSMAAVAASLRAELEAYRRSHRGTGVGTAFGKRLFDPAYLTSDLARFALVGVVNRMDRAYVSPGTCGEIRLVYRLAYRVQSQGEDVFSRLPMTINLVLNARPDGGAPACAEIASRWLRVGDLQLSSKQMALALVGNDGPLAPELRARGNLDRLELNLQIVRWPASVRPDFGGHAEYLLKVYDWSPVQQRFEEATLENQIDRERLLSDPALRARFERWLLSPETVRHVDRGTLVVPTEFLATRGISVTPGGATRAANRPYRGILSDAKVAGALVAAQREGPLENVLSPMGFQKRVNDLSCVGCHQTRAIAGFHFMGRDPLLKYPGNSVFVPASAHFFGDVPRRRDIVEAFAAGREVDFSRGFAARPQPSRSMALRGTGLVDGWGAHCSTSSDVSFRSWTCGEGLRCRVLLQNASVADMGVCVSDGRPRIGDPLESGTVTSREPAEDRYTRANLIPVPDAARHVGSPQSATPGRSTGGFPGGMLRTRDCTGLPPEAACGALPAARGGFNDCVGKGRNFVQCIREFAAGVGLRACDRTTPCRDDYICAESYEEGRGTCVPPYFLFQFRVDGHPIGSGK